jgi:hypothetical protein
MTAVAYCMRDLHGSESTPPGAVCVPTHRGGCGVPHEASKHADGRWVIKCDACAPSLIAHTYGFSSDAAGVPQTPDEIRMDDLAQRDAKAAQATVMSAMTEAFVRAIQSGSMTFPGGAPAIEAPAQPSLLEQIAAMTPEEKGKLASLLAPVIPAVEGSKPAADVPVKRGPGRPRKVPA